MLLLKSFKLLSIFFSPIYTIFKHKTLLKTWIRSTLITKFLIKIGSEFYSSRTTNCYWIAKEFRCNYWQKQVKLPISFTENCTCSCFKVDLLYPAQWKLGHFLKSTGHFCIYLSNYYTPNCVLKYVQYQRCAFWMAVSEIIFRLSSVEN